MYSTISYFLLCDYLERTSSSIRLLTSASAVRYAASLLLLLQYLSMHWQIIWFLFKAAGLIIPLDYRRAKLCLFSGVSSHLAAGLSLSQKTTAELELYGSWLHIKFWDGSSSCFPPSSGLLYHHRKCCSAFCSTMVGHSNYDICQLINLSKPALLLSMFLEGPWCCGSHTYMQN